MNIRLGTLSDLTKIVQIENQVFKNSSWNYNAIRDELTPGKGKRTLVITYQKNIIGYLMIRKFKNQSDILNFAINTIFQTKGIGWKLLSYFLETLPKMDQVTLEVKQGNKKAINLYHKAGFNKTGFRKRYYRDGSDALIMEFIK
mgnify:CR=1 FL=1|tara:strand:- start:108 stop:539 length:432 start_codon:yes stop_codon:yes gene_type:complete